MRIIFLDEEMGFGIICLDRDSGYKILKDWIKNKYQANYKDKKCN